MKYRKKILARMDLCYSVAMFFDGKEGSFLIATEKAGPCRRFALDGSPMETVWEGPGGVMTMVQAPGRTDQFLATHEFYSPNCGGDKARIVTCTRQPGGAWNVQTLCSLPYVHRFGVLKAPDGRDWLIACTIKSACEYREDWRSPGGVYAVPLTGDLERFGGESQLALTELMGGQFKNHGYYTAPGQKYAIVSTQSGVFRFAPPKSRGGEWTVNCLLKKPVSDIAEADFDGDGQPELLTMSPFHGDELAVYHLDGQGNYKPVWIFPEPLPFLHAIWSGKLCGEACALVGHRRGRRDLLRVYYDGAAGDYRLETVDRDCGPANVCAYSFEGRDYIVAANRETNEAALYTVER